MGLVQNHDVIFEQVGICNALPHKNSIGNVSKLSLRRSFVIEPNRIAHFLAHHGPTLLTHTASHADCGHPPWLRDDHIDLVDR